MHSDTVYPEVLAVKKFGDFTPNRAFKNIGGILIWRRIHESRMRVTSTIARKMLILAIPISIAKSPNLISCQIYRLYGITSWGPAIILLYLCAEESGYSSAFLRIRNSTVSVRGKKLWTCVCAWAFTKPCLQVVHFLI